MSKMEDYFTLTSSAFLPVSCLPYFLILSAGLLHLTSLYVPGLLFIRSDSEVTSNRPIFIKNLLAFHHIIIRFLPLTSQPDSLPVDLLVFRSAYAV